MFDAHAGPGARLVRSLADLGAIVAGEPPRGAGQEATHRAHELDVGARRAPSILIVDDDDAIRTSLALLLEDEGYDVHTAADGRDALAVLARISLPSLALVDLRMPMMDGAELIEAMRRDPRYARLPVVILSAASTVAAPVDLPFLPKPVSVERLLETIRRSLDIP
jgi:CheY-like chemotaxis protein